MACDEAEDVPLEAYQWYLSLQSTRSNPPLSFEFGSEIER